MPLLTLDVAESRLEATWQIDAPASVVSECLTSSSRLPHWLGQIVECEVRPRSSFVVDHGEGYLCRSTVRECEPPHRLCYSWEFPDEHATEVAWRLTASAEDRTTVSLAHSGLAELVESYRDGWLTHLTFLEAAAIGTPLPPEMFWHLHATVARLTSVDRLAENGRSAGGVI